MKDSRKIDEVYKNMKTNLPMKKDNSLIGKIKTFFKRLFGKTEIKMEEKSLEIIDKSTESASEIQLEKISEIHKNDIENVEKIKVDEERKNEKEKSIEREFVTQNKRVKNTSLAVEREKDKLMRDLEKNPSMLYEFPMEKLEMIEQYYNERIAQCKSKIAKLKKE